MLKASEALSKSLDVALEKISTLVAVETVKGNMSLPLKDFFDSTVLCSPSLQEKLTAEGYNLYTNDSDDAIYKITWEDADSRTTGDIF